MAMTEPLLSTEASAGQIGKEPLGLGFKESISEQTEATKNMNVWQAYSKMAALRESQQQLDSIINSVQDCIQKAADGGSAEFVSRLFTLKRQLSASPGYSSWVFRCIANIVDEELGAVAEKDYHDMIGDVEELAKHHYKVPEAKLDLPVQMWSRALCTPWAYSIQKVKADVAKHKDGFFPDTAHRLHDLRGTRERPLKRAEPLKWFLWGLVRNCNMGNVGWFDDMEALKVCKKESGRLQWIGLGFAIDVWAREGRIGPGLFRLCEDGGKTEWAMGELVSIHLPKLKMELVDLHSAMKEQLTSVAALQAKGLGLLVSGSIAGFQLLGNMLIKSFDANDAVGNHTV